MRPIKTSEAFCIAALQCHAKIVGGPVRGETFVLWVVKKTPCIRLKDARNKPSTFGVLLPFMGSDSVGEGPPFEEWPKNLEDHSINTAYSIS